jgi:large subunit ribosomal protein L15
MQLHSLKKNRGSTHRKKNVGRGNASGHGTYSTRGGKGQTARVGRKPRLGFEGGQTPLYRRLPKLGGFRNPNRIEYQIVNLYDLELNFDGEIVTKETLIEAGLVRSSKKPVKILGDGELKKKLSVKVDAVSAGAKEKIEKAGGAVEVLKPKRSTKAE